MTQGWHVFSLVAILYFSVGCCAIWNREIWGGPGQSEISKILEDLFTYRPITDHV